MSASRTAAVVAAAGKGSRFADYVSKTWAGVAGRPLLFWTLDRLCQWPRLDECIVVLPDDEAFPASHYVLRMLAPSQRVAWKVVAGGTTRQASVKAGLNGLSDDVKWVAVHDAARPGVTAGLCERIFQAAAAGEGAAVPALPPVDTVKRAGPGKRVEATLDRSVLQLVQTPQVFHREQLFQAYTAAAEQDIAASDDAALVEAAGGDVQLVEGERTNHKLTYPEDCVLMEPVLAPSSTGASIRTATAFDLHPLKPWPDDTVSGPNDGSSRRLRQLRLAGVPVGDRWAAVAHSDGDVVFHAVMDALFSAAGLPDLGSWFPDTEPALSAAPSQVLLAGCLEAVWQCGFRVHEVDITVLAERPRLKRYRDEIVRALRSALGLRSGQVGWKATTLEGIGAIGKGRAIGCQVLVSLERIEKGVNRWQVPQQIKDR